MEKEIIEGCLNKNIRCEKKLYDALAPKMFTLCLRYAGDYHLAQDMLQEGFVRLFQNLDKYRFEGSFEGWVRRVMVSSAIKTLRNKMQMVALENINYEEIAEEADDAYSNMNAQDLMDSIQSMPSGYRAVFNMYVFEQFSHKEIAETLEITEGTSKSQLAKARKFLLEKYQSLKKYQKTGTHA